MNRPLLSLAAAILLVSCAAPRITRPDVPVIATLHGTGLDKLRIELHQLRDLPREPERGWINTAKKENAQAWIMITGKWPYETDVVQRYVAFQALAPATRTGIIARYQWDGDNLSICVNTQAAGPYKVESANSLWWYARCLPMKR